MRIRISRHVADAIRAHAAAEPMGEVCGLLFGSGACIDAVRAAPNVARDPATHFEIDPACLFAAIRDERAGGPAIAGYYHSHPGGRAEPSQTDQANAAPDGRLWLIVAGRDMGAWRAMSGGFEVVDLVEYS